MKNLVLTGLSGSGKTTLGKALAQRLSAIFVDLDEEIEKDFGAPIAQIFARHGQAFFRTLESEAIKKTANLEGAVISTGGGAILAQENRKLLRQNGFVVFLDRPVQNIAQDVDVSARPLLKDGAQKLFDMEKQRREHYLSCAHFSIKNSGTKDEVMAQLLSLAAPLFARGYAVIGQPIGHSLSPKIYAAAFKKLGICQSYAPMLVARGTLPAFAAGARAGGLLGFNVTIPHKEDIIPFLDEVEEDAAFCGAVNTVLNKNGKLCGYNTDMGGLHLALKRAGQGYTGRQVLLLGAGGAARAVGLKAVKEGAKTLCILARREDAAKQLAVFLQKQGNCLVTFGNMLPQTLNEKAENCNLLINTTPLGMQGYGANFEDLGFVSRLPENAFVCDIVYSPPKTPLLAKAQGRGLQTANGLCMLICQAILALQIYTGKTLDEDALYNVISKEIA